MKRKGFTLIELLAVIVILAIIALITIPIVLKTINNSEIEGEKRSVEGYARAIEEDVANYLMMNPGKSYNDYVTAFNTSVEDKKEEPVDYKGNRVKCDPISINENGKLILTGCIVYKEGKELTDEQKAKKNHYNYDGKNVELVQNNNSNNNNNNTSTPSSYEEYKVGDEITVAGETYRVIVESLTSDDYVVALKDTLLETTTMSFGQNSTYEDSIVKGVVDEWASKTFQHGELKTVNNYSARLITFEELISLNYERSVSTCCGGSIYYEKTELTPTWLYSSPYLGSFNGYWTMSYYNDNPSKVLCVYTGGRIYIYRPDTTSGASISVRPVINVYKNKITKQN